jgi:hypothetical protein
VSTLKVNNLTDLGADAVVTNGVIDSGALPAGSILQVVSTTKTDTFSTSSTSDVDVTGLSATITPTSTSSKILIMMSISCGNTTVKRFNIKRDGAIITAAQGSGGSSQATINANQVDSADRNVVSANYLDSPSSTSAVIYQVATYTTVGTVSVNTGSSDQRGISSITLMEVAG